MHIQHPSNIYCPACVTWYELWTCEHFFILFQWILCGCVRECAYARARVCVQFLCLALIFHLIFASSRCVPLPFRFIFPFSSLICFSFRATFSRWTHSISFNSLFYPRLFSSNSLQKNLFVPFYLQLLVFLSRTVRFISFHFLHLSVGLPFQFNLSIYICIIMWPHTIVCQFKMAQRDTKQNPLWIECVCLCSFKNSNNSDGSANSSSSKRKEDGFGTLIYIVKSWNRNKTFMYFALFYHTTVPPPPTYSG